jgi:hypothetical protein
MATGALIGAYHQDDSGALRALLPLSGRTLLEYQVRCAAAAGATPIVLVVEEIPIALNQALSRLEKDGTAVIAVTDAADAANRFSAGDMVLLLGDGIAPPPDLIATIAEEQEPTIVTVPDDDRHDEFERIDAVSRWAGIALVDSQSLGGTVSMLGDWDLQSTLLRRMLQSGARLWPIRDGEAEPILSQSREQLTALERELIKSSRGNRSDWASRYVLPLVEEVATEALVKSTVAPMRLMEAAVVLTLASGVCFFEGWRWPGLVILALTTPLDLIATRLSVLRLRPLPARSRVPKLLWPAAGVALLSLGWWQASNESGWAALYAAVATAALAQADRTERGKLQIPGDIWLFSRRNAILAAIPLVAVTGWTGALVLLSFYAGVSLFVGQFVNHSIRSG